MEVMLEIGLETEDEMIDYRKFLIKITVVFAGILMIFTFFSQTLTDLRVPRVTLIFGQDKLVTPEVFSSGTVQPATTVMLFAPVDGTIVYLAERGYQGLAASVAFIIHSDVTVLTEQLAQAREEQRIAALNIERIQNELAFENQQITRIGGSAPPEPGLAEYDLLLANNYHNIEIAQRELSEQEALYDQGLVTRSTVIEREDALAALEFAREQILTRRALTEEDQNRARQAQNKAAEAQLAIHRAAITQLNLQVQINTLHLERIGRRIYELTEQIEEGGLVEVLFEGNRTVMDIMPGVIAGGRISEGTPVMLTSVRDGQFRVEAAFCNTIDFIEAARQAWITFGHTQFDARILQTYPSGIQTIAVIGIDDTRFSGGEGVMVRVQGPGARSSQVIPRSALREDAAGYYMLYVEAEERLFGVSYYARARRIDGIAARNHRYIATATGQGLDAAPLEKPVIVNSDVPIRAGDRVRPVGEGDFFDTR